MRKEAEARAATLELELHALELQARRHMEDARANRAEFAQHARLARIVRESQARLRGKLLRLRARPRPQAVQISMEGLSDG